MARTLTFDVRSADAVLDDGECPFVGPRLNEQVADAIRREATRGPDASGPFQIVFRTASSSGDRSTEIREAVRNHFRNEAAAAATELETIFRDGRRSGLIAVAVAVGFFALSEILFAMDGRPLMGAIARGFIILSWVALWHPAELLLYAHLPVRQRRRLASTLSEASVQLEPLP